MEKTTVRPANFKDAPAIAKVHVEAWQSAYRGQIPDFYLDSLSVAGRTKSWEKVGVGCRNLHILDYHN